MPKKSPYRVVYTSGADEEHPGSELEVQGPHTRGWQSARFCEFPQEIVLRFENVMHFSQIQFLSHHSKIAKRLDLYIGGTEDDLSTAARTGKPLLYSDCKFRRLGHMSLDSNERTNYEARELKSVHIDAVGMFVKLSIHECYLNQLNLYNQVGLIAVNVLADGAGDGVATNTVTRHGSETELPPVGRKNKDEISPMDDLLFQINFDPITSQQIRELEVRKDHAVSSEDYDEANKCKMAIEHMKKVGRVIADLEGQKAQAVSVEDYARAKGIKTKIDDLRAQAMAHLTGNVMNNRPAERPIQPAKAQPQREPSPAPLVQPPEPVKPPSPMPQPSTSAGDEIPINASSGVAKDPFGQPIVDGDPFGQANKPGLGDDVPIKGMAGDDVPIRPMGPDSATKDPFGRANPSPPRDRPIKPMTASRSQASSPPLPAANKKKKPDPTGGLGESKEVVLPDPEPLSAKAQKEPAALIDTFGEHIVRCLFSKNWNLRSHALDEVSGKLDGNVDAPSPSTFATAVFRVLHKAIEDKNGNIYNLAANLLNKAVIVLADTLGISSVEMKSGLSPLLPHVLTHAGDVNTRARELSEQTLMTMTKHKAIGAVFVCEHVTKPLKPNAAWRLVLGRMTVLGLMIPVSKIGGKNGLPLEMVMSMVAAALQHANAQVRTAALDVIKIVYKFVGDAMEAHLGDVKPATMQLVHEAVQGIEVVPKGGGGGKASRAAASPPPPRAKKGGKKAAPAQARSPSPQPSPQPVVEEEEVEGELLRHEMISPSPAKGQPKGNEPARDINININIAPGSTAEGFQNAISSTLGGTGASPAPERPDDESSGECEFCGLVDESFHSEEKLYVHFWKSCPMLISCTKCGQIVEIPFLNEHLLAECDSKASMKECPRCGEAVSTEDYPLHVSTKKCKPSKDPNQFHRCSLCHQDFPAGTADEGWKAHLMQGPGCPMNERTKERSRGKKKSEPASRIPRPGKR